MTETNAPGFPRAGRVSTGMLRRFFDRAARDERGAAAIEFSFALPMLGLMVLAISDIGFGVYRKMQVEQAVQAGIQWAVRNGYQSSGISNAVTSATTAPIAATPAPQQFCGCATGSSVNSATCGTPCPGGAVAGTYATVSAQMSYSTTLNYVVIPASFDLSAQSTVRLQ